MRKLSAFYSAIAATALFGCAAPMQVKAEPAPSTADEKVYLSLDDLRTKYGDPAGKIALIGGVEVYYKDEGTGPALLLIHGSVSTLKTWDGLAAQLVKNYRVIRFDIPPQGLSGPVSDTALAALQPTDIPEQLLAQLGVDKVTVIGVSSGGTMGVQLAAKRPELVERLIISNAPADPVTTGHQVLTPALEAAIAEQKRLDGYQSRFFWQAFLDFYAGNPVRFDAALRTQIYDMNRKAPQPNFIGLVAKVGDHEKAVAAMNAVTAPVLLVWGGADPLLPYSAMESLAGYLTGADISVIKMPDVGHYPPVEIPDRFAKIVIGYIEGAVPDGASAKR